MAKKNYAPNSNDTILSSVIGWKPPVLYLESTYKKCLREE